MASATYSVTETIRLARSDRSELVPIVGAGTSVPLGQPSWSELLARLSDRPTPPDETPPETLRRLKADLGEAAFTAGIQHLLRTPSYGTSSALQALVTARIPRIITTNLDTALETAYAKAGRALLPSQIGIGFAADDLALFEKATRPILLKIHGSLERPSSWVLTADDYDRAYHQPGMLGHFLEAKVPTPLFIGFSFADQDLSQSRRLARLKWHHRAYAIIPHRLFEKNPERLKTLGLLPIPIYTFDHIPEIIDEIFDCDPLRVEHSHDLAGDRQHLTVGAATTRVASQQLDSKAPVVRVLANALEIQANNSALSGEPRRLFAVKGHYKGLLAKLVASRASDDVDSILRGMAQYPEVLFSGALPSLLRQKNLKDGDYFWLFARLRKAISSDFVELEGRLDRMMVDQLCNPMLGYHCLRGLAKSLAVQGIHPGLEIPPPTVEVGDLAVPIYILTEGQVRMLKGKPSGDSQSIRPHVLRDLSDAAEILTHLRDATGEGWRLPTKAEWMKIAGIDQMVPWPWGHESPKFRVHGHLNYIENAGSIAPHTLEVGLFPKGRSKEGVLDLVGNVHELLAADAAAADAVLAKQRSWSQYVLAGGSWTSKISPRWNLRLFGTLHTPKANTGIRPVLERGPLSGLGKRKGPASRTE